VSSTSLLERLGSIRRWATRPTVRRWLLVVATGAFAFTTWLAIVNLPSDIGPVSWASLGIAAALVLPIALFLGLEYRQIAAVAGLRVPVLEAVRVAMVASASNLLPIPGAVAVKTGSLVAAGKTVRSSITSNMIVAIVWVGVALVVGGPAAITSASVLGWSALAGGVAMLSVGYLALRQADGAQTATRFVRIATVELGLTVMATARIWFVMKGIGVDPDVTAAIWLVVVSVLSTVVGLFPAGLGLREALSAAVAPLIGLDPATAVLISAVDRVVRLGVLALVGGGVVLAGPSAPSLDRAAGQ
jgi:uncharacterized membrane protein YbhN (UPF0104 family)